MEKKCTECGNTKNLKRGWTNAWYCSEQCERTDASSWMAASPFLKQNIKALVGLKKRR